MTNRFPGFGQGRKNIFERMEEFQQFLELYCLFANRKVLAYLPRSAQSDAQSNAKFIALLCEKPGAPLRFKLLAQFQKQINGMIHPLLRMQFRRSGNNR